MDGYFDEEDDFLAATNEHSVEFDDFPDEQNVPFVGRRNVDFVEMDVQFDELDCQLFLHEALGTELLERQNETVLEHCLMMECHWTALFS